MQIEKYTDRLRALVQSAQSLALRSGHQQFTPLHLFKALLEDEDRLAGNLIDASGATASQLAQTVDRELDKLPKVKAAARARSISLLKLRAYSTRPSRWRRRRAI